MTRTRYARIAGTGRYLPERDISNDLLRERFAASAPLYVDKMEASTGIQRRWYAPESWATSDLALRASTKALKAAGRIAKDIDLIIVGTDSPDYITPATSVVLQHKLGASRAGTFDIGCACASFPTGVATAAGLIATNAAIKTVLVVGAYMMHKLAEPTDPTIFFYGDGAGAAVVEVADRPGILGAAFQADGSFHHYWGIFAGGTAEPATEAAVREGRTAVKQLQRYPPEVNHEGWPRLVRRLAAEQGFAVGDIDVVLFTQVRKNSIELVMGELDLPMSRTRTIMEQCGYTGSACVPMVLDTAFEHGDIRPGHLVVLVGSGVGYNQAAVAFRA